MKRLFCTVGGAAMIASLLMLPVGSPAEHIGKIDDAKKLIGAKIETTGDEKIGDIKDLVVDLESGKVLYAVVSAGGFLGIGDELTALPPKAFSSSTGTELTVNADKEKLKSAPRFTKERENQLGDAAFVKQIHEHFGAQIDPAGKFGNVHRASELIGMNVKNVSDQAVGDVNNLAVNVAGGRVLYIILGAGGVLGAGEKSYVIPPNAFTLASDNKSLVVNIDKEKLANAPQYDGRNWRQLSDSQFAARVYQHYGKTPYWDTQLTPTGREDAKLNQSSSEPVTPNRPGLGRISRNADDDQDRPRARGGRGLQVRRGTGEFANVEAARKLIGMNVQASDGKNLGKLNDLIVDLESGRVIYATINLGGRAGTKAVAPQSFSLSADDKSLRFTGDQTKLTQAPAVERTTEAANAEFARRVYTHFGQQAWFESSGKFGNAHKLSDVLKLKVQNPQDQNLGQIQDLMVDLPQARILYVILSAPQVVGRGDHLFAIPPNAFTLSADKNPLVTDADKAKLEGAPRANRDNLDDLANPAKAAEIYRYYGKTAYWNTSGLAPTGR